MDMQWDKKIPWIYQNMAAPIRGGLDLPCFKFLFLGRWHKDCCTGRSPTSLFFKSCFVQSSFSLNPFSGALKKLYSCFYSGKSRIYIINYKPLDV